MLENMLCVYVVLFLVTYCDSCLEFFSCEEIAEHSKDRTTL